MSTRREDVMAILRNTKTFTREPARANLMEGIFGPMLLSLDSAEHQQICNFNAKAQAMSINVFSTK